jgi:hypothetical protein
VVYTILFKDPDNVKIHQTRVNSIRTQGTKNVGINALASSENNGNGLEGISSKEVLKHLQDAAAAVGERRLGFPVDCTGTHSIRAGAAMAMFPASVQCETIQLIGRWRSRTFMRYLPIQVTASTLGVTKKMTSLDSFFTVTISDDSDKNDEEPRLQIGRDQVDTTEDGRPAGNGQDWEAISWHVRDRRRPDGRG